MSIIHHPDDSMLMACAAGSQPEVIAAIVASHLAQCAHCRNELKLLSCIGEVLFADLPPRELVSTARAGNSVRNPIRSAEPPPACAADMIKTLLSGPASEEIAPGVRRARLPVSATARGTLTAIRMAPGSRVPPLPAPGSAISIVLDGGYTDGEARFTRGDFSDTALDAASALEADAASGCLLLRAEFPDR